MNAAQNISKIPPVNPTLNFHKLREEGLNLIQSLSGNIWTDFNIHDPGVTTLEILCYALTDLGYRTSLLKEAFETEGPVDPELIQSYFFHYDELLPHNPLTKRDFEDFIEKNHESVLSAWIEIYPLLTASGMVRGGYEIAVLLESDETYGNLNSDIIQLPFNENEDLLEVIFFDEDNKRLQWRNIKEIHKCLWNKKDPDSFFVFENHNCQAALLLEVSYQNQRKNTTLNTKVRVTLSPRKPAKTEASSIEKHQKEIIKKLESAEFLDALRGTLSKEHYKAQLLIDIKKTMLPYRNLCEDFIALSIVNEQEIKIDAEIILDDFAPPVHTIIHAIYERLDSFLLNMMVQAKVPENRSQKNILYASNLIEEMVKAEGVVAASIININLFVDGVPTIPLQEEAAFECIHLQRFAHYVPKISRKKSNITFIRSGIKEMVEADMISKDFRPQDHLIRNEEIIDPSAAEKAKNNVLSKNFFEELRQYYSIQNDFPQNYRLTEGVFSESTPDTIKVRVKQFKSFLSFFERILVGYLEQLYSFHDLLSVKQEQKISENELQLLKKQLPDLGLFHLLDENKWESTSSSTQSSYSALIKKHKILDHLMARFSMKYTPIQTDYSQVNILEKTLQDKIILLKDIPVITKERSLGIPIHSGSIDIWDGNLLSGFQKIVYRTLGINNEDFKHVQLSKQGGNEPLGFYLVEHILLLEKEEDTIFNKKFNRSAVLLFDYLQDLISINIPHDPYSFQLSIIIPEWYSMWNKRRHTVENAIKKHVPAHILPYFHWMNKKQMKEFEILYEDWLQGLLQLY